MPGLSKKQALWPKPLVGKPRRDRLLLAPIRMLAYDCYFITIHTESMPKFRSSAHSRPALLMLALLLVTLWVSAAHRHGADEPHPQTTCAICLQLQTAQFSGSPGLSIPLATENGQFLAAPIFVLIGTHFSSPYQGRAPPAASS